MDTSKLWTELIIAGSFFLLAFVFLILKALHVDDLSFLTGFTQYLIPLSAIALVLSYLFGIFFHKITPVLLRVPAKFFERVFQNKGSLTVDGNDTSNLEHTRIKILQLGSERLNSEIDYQYKNMVLFRLLTIAIPLAGGSCAVWLLDVNEKNLALLVTLMFH